MKNKFNIPIIIDNKYNPFTLNSIEHVFRNNGRLIIYIYIRISNNRTRIGIQLVKYEKDRG